MRYFAVIVDRLRDGFTRKIIFYASTQNKLKLDRKSQKHRIKNGLKYKAASG